LEYPLAPPHKANLQAIQSELFWVSVGSPSSTVLLCIWVPVEV
jgi:hypothetical protein